MKKLLKMFGLLLVAGTLFFSCSNGSSDDNGGSTIELSDGNWTLNVKTSANGVDMYITLHATVSNNGSTIKYTSGSSGIAMPMSGYESFTEEQLETLVANMNAAAADAGEDVTYTYDSTSKTIFELYEMDSDELADVSGDYDINEIPSNVKIHSNADKTEYSFVITEGVYTVTYKITKDK